jgi:2-oxoglutarate ferredoxin oxidoreductase subunit beta
VTFNDHEGSTKSYAYVKDHDEPLHEVNFVPAYEDISVEIEEGEVREVTMHDGSRILLKKLGRDYDPTDKVRAVQTLHEAAVSGHVVTGILYVDTGRPTFIDLLNLVDEPLASLPESRVRPSQAALDELMEELR